MFTERDMKERKDLFNPDKVRGTLYPLLACKFVISHVICGSWPDHADR